MKIHIKKELKDKINFNLKQNYAFSRFFSLTLFLSFLFTVSLSANLRVLQDTIITIKHTDTPLSRIISDIEQKSGYSILVRLNDVDVKEKYSINETNKDLNQILTTLFKSKNIGFEIKGNAVSIFNAQNKQANANPKLQDKHQITGTVTDEYGEPIIGASIMEKGTTNGSVSNINGEFSLSVSENATLQISYIGYLTQDVSVRNQTRLSIILKEDLMNLKEVVVVGYGTQKRGLVTGALSITQGEQIIQSKTQNLSMSLQGRLPGVVINNRTGEPGAESTSVNIRGRSTTGNNDPLVLIDGIANRGSLDRINPNDIESVTVLKDASAAIYGSRSANGVILVTTKRGKDGKPMIDYSYNVGIQTPTRLPKLTDAATYAEVLNEIETYAGRPSRYTNEEIQKFRDGSDPLHYPNTDWYKETLRKTALQQRHNISIRGGNDRVAYYVGGGFSNQDGIYKENSTYYEQYEIRSNIDTKITNNLALSVDLSGRIEDQYFSGEGSNQIFWLLTRGFPTAIARYPNGLPAYGTNDGNPVTLVTDEGGYRNYKKSVFNSTITAKLDLPWITQGLSIDGYAAYDRVGEDRKDWYTPMYYYELDEATDTYTKHMYSRRTKASLSQEYKPSTSLTLNAKINYNRTFDSAHGVDAMVGFEQNEYLGHNFGGSRNNYLSTAIDQLFAGSSNKDDINNWGSAYEQARRSFLGRFAYDYAGKYMAQFNFRYDGSYIFASGERWGFFPGVSLGWRLSEEKFIKDKISWLNNLKLRLSHGQQGNDNVGAFQYMLKYTLGRNYVFGGKDVEGVYPEELSNEKISWEVANTYNVGLDGTLWNGKLGFEIDVFRTSRSNILASRNASIPQYTGLINLPNENIGKVRNQGIELLLTHNSKIGEVGLNLSGNFMFARNKVINIDETPWPEGHDYMKAEGKPMGTELYYHAIGIFRTQEELDSYPSKPGAELGDLIYEDVDKNGVIDDLDRVRADLMHFPEIVFGFNVGLNWKSFDVSMLLQGQARAQQLVHMRIDHTGNAFKERTDNRWTPNNINGTMPRVESITSTSAESDFWMKDATFVRLKNLEIGYTLPQSLLKKLRISNLRIYLSGHNLFTFDKLKVMDPESDQAGANYYPQMRLFNIGVNLTF
ncbi:MAG: TonB-dependent receptor [Tannerellaceae bacterium]|jgi:TonB-linked SusC/RagA family outer membrane protein|nr:TonB-dependent receptor [Tannerellaceae bacterium]